jgi:hypothetical protein
VRRHHCGRQKLEFAARIWNKSGIFVLGERNDVLLFLEQHPVRPVQRERMMADERTQFVWDPIALAVQLRNIARQGHVLIWRFVDQPDAGITPGQCLGSIFSNS